MCVNSFNPFKGSVRLGLDSLNFTDEETQEQNG